MRKTKIIKLFDALELNAMPEENNGHLVGWTLEGYTQQDGDMIHALDFEGLDPYKLNDIIKAWQKYLEDLDIDNELELNLQSARQWGLSIKDFVNDYENYYNDLKEKLNKFKKMIKGE